MAKKKRTYEKGEDDGFASDSDASVAKGEEDVTKMTEPFGFVPKPRSKEEPKEICDLVWRHNDCKLAYEFSGKRDKLSS